jgi:hypothetical protein
MRVSQLPLSAGASFKPEHFAAISAVDGTPNVCLVDCAMFCTSMPPPLAAQPRCCVAERTCTTIVLDHEHENHKHG